MKIACIQDEKIIIKETKNITLKDFDKEGAIIKTIGCGLCGSDIVKFRQKLSPNGTVLGHETVGEIVEINSNTEFEVGDKIVSAHHIPCFKCVYCENENYSMCEHFKETNIRPGGFSEYIYLSEEHLQNVAYKIPPTLNEIDASFFEPLGCCIRAIKRAQLKPESTVVVVGLGSIGILMGQALKNYGMKVYGCDILQNRIDLAMELGFYGAFNPLDLESSQKYIMSKTNGIGADAIFMTSGSDNAIELALKTVRSGGTILVFASTPKNFGYANNEIYYRELKVLGSYSPSPADLKESMKLLAEEKVKMHIHGKNISTVYNLDETEKAFHDTISNAIFKAYIKID